MWWSREQRLRARGDQIDRAAGPDRDLAGAQHDARRVLGRLAVGRADRFVAGAFDGELLRQRGLHGGGGGARLRLGALPAAALPFALRRFPMATAILDPFMVGGYGAPKLALAPLFILWFGIGIESKIALVAITVFFIVYFSALAGVRALDAKLVQMAQVVRRERARRLRATSCFRARCPTSSRAFASPCRIRSAARSSPS